MSVKSDFTEGASEEENIKMNGSHEKQLSEQVANLLTTGQYSDVTFVVDGIEIACHKNILASRCPYFDNMFQSGLTDSNTIQIKTTLYDIFKAVITFIYSGRVNFPKDDPKFAQNLLETADMMDFSDIKDIVGEYYIGKMNASNCLGFYSMSKTYRADLLQISTFKYALESFKSVKKEKEFLECPVDIIKDYLGHHDIVATSEDEICCSAIVWVMYKPLERQGQMVDILCEQRLSSLNDCFAHSAPLMIKSKFPRMKTYVKTGMAVILADWKKSHVNLYAFEKLGKMSLLHDQSDDTILKGDRFSSILNSCVVDNNIVVSCGDYDSGIYGYNIFNNSWIKLTNFSRTNLCRDLLFLVDCEHGNLYGLVCSVHSRINSIRRASEDKVPGSIKLSSLMHFMFGENLWRELLNFKDKPWCVWKFNFASLVHQDILYIFGVSLKESDSNFTNIAAIDLDTHQSEILDIKLPQVVQHMNVVVHREHVIIIGDDKIFICMLSALEKDICGQEVSNTDHNYQSMYTEGSGSETTGSDPTDNLTEKKPTLLEDKIEPNQSQGKKAPTQSPTQSQSELEPIQLQSEKEQTRIQGVRKPNQSQGERELNQPQSKQEPSQAKGEKEPNQLKSEMDPCCLQQAANNNSAPIINQHSFIEKQISQDKHLQKPSWRDKENNDNVVKLGNQLIKVEHQRYKRYKSNVILALNLDDLVSEKAYMKWSVVGTIQDGMNESFSVAAVKFNKYL